MFHLAAILGPQQREAMNRSIAVPGLSLARRDPKQNLLARPDGNLGCALAGHLVAAVVIRREFDDSGLRVSVGKKRKEEHRHNDESNSMSCGVSHKCAS